MSIRKQPEKEAANELKKYMIAHGWDLFKISGGLYQESGLPDFYCLHAIHGERWIETKAVGGKLSPSQIKICIKFAAKNKEVYVIKSWQEYELIFKPRGNWREYAKGW